MEDQLTLTVNGEGEVSVMPDQAEITLGVVTEAETVSESQQVNNDIFSAVISALNEIGIEDSQIQTITYRIEPRYDYVEGVQQFRGYEVTHMINIKVEDITQAGDVVDTAVANGANVIQSIQFTVADSTDLYRQALQLALEDAKGKAMALTETLNVTLNETPQKIIERSGGAPVRMYDGATFSTQATPIQAGTISVRASVEAVFSYQ
ncbi:SIMPL domain-containing protein [Alkalihalophilus marmarensis]|uniref:DUF541 domain-containing protein n=1 Tax=Alkalihalophilus marmarensis DSM 21297 TaxID=1188261 RepID=U6ST48_9BACI|nr:SIMPL domain-containing protein [Alkalihalophilus marmarensis]ERN54547.1 hypothetical protein A33I_06505 [Alkalihalophilus marmarensis DSM 21297]